MKFRTNYASKVKTNYQSKYGKTSIVGGEAVPPDDNEAPVAVDDSGYTTPFDTPLEITASELVVNDTDADMDTLTVTAVSDAVNGSVSLDAGVITFTPTTGYDGPASFVYTVSDGQGGSDTGSVSITVEEEEIIVPAPFAWPSADNRPTWDGINTLSWKDENGTPQDRVLTNRATELVTTSDGQIIEGLNMSARLVIRHNNVTVRQNRFTTPDFYSIWIDQNSPTGITIEDNLLDGGDNVGITGIQPEVCGTGLVVQRNNIFGYENGMFVTTGMSILENWIHDLSTGGEAHTDGVQGTGLFTSLLIQGNAIYSRDTSDIIMQNESGAFSGLTVTENLLDMTADGAVCIVVRGDKSATTVGTTVVTNNIMRKPPSGGYEDFTDLDGPLTFSGNFDDLANIFMGGQTANVIQIPKEDELFVAFAPSSSMSSSDSNVNLSLRMVAVLSEAVPGEFRVAIQAPSGTTMTASHVAVGVSNGSGNTVGTPVELTFAGNAGLAIGFDSIALSDPVDLGALADGSSIVVIVDYVSGQQRLGTGNSNVTSYFKDGTTYNQAAPGGLTHSANNNFGLYGVYQN